MRKSLPSNNCQIKIRVRFVAWVAARLDSRPSPPNVPPYAEFGVANDCTFRLVSPFVVRLRV